MLKITPLVKGTRAELKSYFDDQIKDGGEWTTVNGELHDFDFWVDLEPTVDCGPYFLVFYLKRLGEGATSYEMVHCFLRDDPNETTIKS